MLRALRAAMLPIALFSLQGCKLDSEQRDEVGDIAGDVATDAVDDSDKVREIEARLDTIEERLNLQNGS